MYGSSPVVCVFARKTSEPLASLVKKIDAKIGENDKLKSFVVIMPKKGGNPAEEIRTLAKDAGIQHVPLTIGESPDGPPDYEIASNADVTVLMWSGHKVKVNRAYKGELTESDVRAIVADIPKLLSD
jgi:predicted TIM-barrel fold metal-dependent hydrolase